MQKKEFRYTSRDFATGFGAEWRSRYIKLILFASLVFFLPVVVIGVFIWYAWLTGYSIDPSTAVMFFGPFGVGPATIAFLISAVLIVIPAGIFMITSPRVLAYVAQGLIERLDLTYLLFVPLSTDDFARSPAMEYVAGAPVANVSINESLRSRIWWLSGQMRPDQLLGGVPSILAMRHGSLPRTLTNTSLPVGKLGNVIVRQWYLLTCQIITWSTCCGSCGCGLLIFPLVLYRVFLNIHSLAFAAAYYRILTDEWPWA
jgi:hypothetical protein